MKTIISPLGFETDQLVSCIVKEGVEKGDRIIILRPEEMKEETRGKSAFENLKDIVNQVSEDIDIEKIVLDYRNFQDIVETISKQIKKSEGKTVLNISGGPRVIIIALTVVGIFHRDEIEKIYNHSEIDKEIREIELPSIFQPLKDNEKKLLKTIVEESPLRFKDLVEKVDLSKSSISRLMRKMEDNNLVDIEEEGREKYASLTISGKILIESVEYTI